MALVDLTGSVASWSKQAHDGLSKIGDSDAATTFALGPPFATGTPTSEDYDRLEAHLKVQIQALHAILDADTAAGT
jgi:hypothetical protein